MSTQWKLLQSRNNWKQKAIERGRKERAYRKEIKRIKTERDQFKLKTEETRAALKAQRSQMIARPFTKVNIVYFSLLLFLVARIGFRAISRVLKVLGSALGLTKAPCTQTIINWVARLSIVKTELAFQPESAIVRSLHQGSAWLIDLSIGLGDGKILTVLELDLRHHQHHENVAPGLRDMKCLAVAVATSWTGEAIADFLKKVMTKVGGLPDAFLKDGGTDLRKAVTLLNKQGHSCLTISDISHKIANLFKHKYAKHPLFDIFLSACGQVSKNLKQTVLASLAPPSVSTKARFMNLHRLVAWADKLLQHSPRGNVAADSMLAKLRSSLDKLPACKTFINQFLREARPLLACQKILKCKGLNRDTYQECEKLMGALPPSSSIRAGFTEWATEHLAVASALELGSTGLPISSDPIESLFGVGKRFGIGQVKDANRIASRLPAFCGTLSQHDAERVLTISVAQQKAMIGGRESLIKQRRDVLPHPGRLETLGPPTNQNNVQFIMGHKLGTVIT